VNDRMATRHKVAACCTLNSAHFSFFVTYLASPYEVDTVRRTDPLPNIQDINQGEYVPILIFLNSKKWSRVRRICFLRNYFSIQLCQSEI